MTERADALVPGPVGVVFVGQLPPPVHGQAVANGELVTGAYASIGLDVVPLRFSASIDAVGAASVAKVLLLPRVLLDGVRAARRSGRAVLVYSVGLRGPGAALRDAVLLTVLRPLFRRCVLHVHTADTRAVLAAVPRPARRLVRRAYARADVLYPDPSSAEGGSGLPEPRSVRYVPNGIADPCAGDTPVRRFDGAPVVLLLSNLYASKGTEVAVRAVATLNGRRRAAGLDEATLVLAGAAPDEATRDGLLDLAAEVGLDGRIELPGTVGGDLKDALFRRATVFCFPTFYEAESFGLVTIEAMAYGLPVVASAWRALPRIVTDGEDGLLVPPRDDAALAAALERVTGDPALATRLGAAARATFERRFTVERFRAAFEDAVIAAVRS